MVSKTLVQNEAVSMTLFSFDKGEEISTHAAGDAMVTVLEGVEKFTVGGKEFILKEGETIIMPKDVPHAVYGEEKFKMQLSVSMLMKTDLLLLAVVVLKTKQCVFTQVMVFFNMVIVLKVVEISALNLIKMY